MAYISQLYTKTLRIKFFLQICKTDKHLYFEKGHKMKNQITKKIKNLTRASIRLKIPLKKQSEALQILESVREQTQFEPSCIHARVYRETNDVKGVLFEELWTNDSDLDRHLKSEAYKWILLAIEMADTVPEIRFDRILESSGFEIIQKARTGL